MRKQIKRIISFIFIAIMLFFISSELINDYRSKQDIEENFATTEGEIIDYYIVGTDSPYLKYQYMVDGKSYKKSTSVFSAFMGCEKSKECLGRKFVVYYSKVNPLNSKIDLKQEIK
ncbi:hypothetical protein OO013_13665 [Mangrovivirga sp. M17]|uniref:YxeA family protein n=1 Tax=Mangrovivirga halotolerans TaxID=2993936 RepID=A0ABT3RUV7_9BACT|nr:hypothetical protein [Mangrovivirga halotolerans]MCX2744925.1 hypothetical protein [Mangrovivirga halotolerans]